MVQKTLFAEDQFDSYKKIHEVYYDPNISESEKNQKISQYRDVILASTAIHSFTRDYRDDVISAENRYKDDPTFLNIEKEYIKLKHDYLLPQTVRDSYMNYIDSIKQKYTAEKNSIKFNYDIPINNASKLVELQNKKLQVDYDLSLSEEERKRRSEAIDSLMYAYTISHNDHSSALNEKEPSVNDVLGKIKNIINDNSKLISSYAGIKGQTRSNDSSTSGGGGRRLSQKNSMINFLNSNQMNNSEMIPQDPILIKDENRKGRNLQQDINDTTFKALNVINKNTLQYSSNVNDTSIPSSLVDVKQTSHISNIPYYIDNRKVLVEPLVNSKRRAENILDTEKTTMTNKRRQNNFFYNSPDIRNYIHLKT